MTNRKINKLYNFTLLIFNKFLTMHIHPEWETILGLWLEHVTQIQLIKKINHKGIIFNDWDWAKNKLTRAGFEPTCNGSIFCQCLCLRVPVRGHTGSVNCQEARHHTPASDITWEVAARGSPQGDTTCELHQ